MAEEPRQIQIRNHQEAQVVQDGVQVEVLVEGLEPVAQAVQEAEALEEAQEQVAQEQVAVVVAVVVAVAAAAVEEIPAEAENMGVMMMMMTTPKTIRTRSPSWIHQGEKAPNRRKANPMVAKVAKVAKVARVASSQG